MLHLRLFGIQRRIDADQGPFAIAEPAPEGNDQIVEGQRGAVRLDGADQDQVIVTAVVDESSNPVDPAQQPNVRFALPEIVASLLDPLSGHLQ